MTKISVTAEIALTIAPFCLPLIQIFEAHRGSNIRKGGKQKPPRSKDIRCFRTENGGNDVSAGHFRRIFFVLLIHGMDR
jgi:hypothetical protein